MIQGFERLKSLCLMGFQRGCCAIKDCISMRWTVALGSRRLDPNFTWNPQLETHMVEGWGALTKYIQMRARVCKLPTAARGSG